jgi:hypothetical protein
MLFTGKRPKNKVLLAHYKRLMLITAAGEKAFTTSRDTILGIPEQKFRIEQDDSPAATYLAGLVDIAKRYQIPGTKTIEGPSE